MTIDNNNIKGVILLIDEQLNVKVSAIIDSYQSSMIIENQLKFINKLLEENNKNKVEPWTLCSIFNNYSMSMHWI